MKNVADAMYEEWINEVDAAAITADTPVAQAIGDLTRALKRVAIRHGGTAIMIDGVRYDRDNRVIESAE